MSIKRKQTIYAMIRVSLLIALSFLCVTACNSSEIQQSARSQRLAATSQCRVIQHKLGESCVSNEPQRIVSLDPSSILDPLFALGFRSSIVGMNCYGSWTYRGCIVPGLSPDDLKGIEIVDAGNQPSIEKILRLKPDLILVLTNYHDQIYNLLSQVAPTIAIDYDATRLSFKDNLRSIAQLLNRQEVAEKVIVQYESKISAVRTLLGDRLAGKEVSILIYNGGRFWTSAKDAIYFQFLQDIGVKIKPIFLTEENYTAFSIETITDYDSDILFIANFDRKPASFFLENPFITLLKASRNGQTYILDGREVWDVFGPLGVGKLLDRIVEYLLKSA